MNNKIIGDPITGEVRWAGSVVPLEPSLALANHSATGFAWGYEGDESLQLALALLLYSGADEGDALASYREFAVEALSARTQPQEERLQMSADYPGRWLGQWRKRQRLTDDNLPADPRVIHTLSELCDALTQSHNCLQELLAGKFAIDRSAAINFDGDQDVMDRLGDIGTHVERARPLVDGLMRDFVIPEHTRDRPKERAKSGRRGGR